MSKNSAQALPSNVLALRQRRNKEMISVAKKGVLLRLIIIIAEGIGYGCFHSSSLLLDAISSLIDIGASLSLILFIKLAEKPPDDDHPLGHGRYEPIAGFQLAIFLVILGGFFFFEQISVLCKPSVYTPIAPFAWLIPFSAIFILEIAHRFLHKTAKKEDSPALLADALHYRVDALSSVFATIALVIGGFFPSLSHIVDHLGALMISLFMIGLGSYAAIKNFHQLLDKIPDKKYFALVKKAALSVEGVKDTEKIRIQLYGPDANVTIDIEVDPELKVVDAHEITRKVRMEIQKSFPAARDVIVHVEPH